MALNASRPADLSWERWLGRFLRLQLGPTSLRRRQAARMALLSVASILLIFTLKIPEGEFLLVTLFVVMQGASPEAAWRKAWERLLGTLAGGLAALVVIVMVPDQPWLLLPLQAAVVFAGMFCYQATRIPYVFMIGVMTFLMIVPGYVVDPALGIEKDLWRIGLVALGCLLGGAGQACLWPRRQEQDLRRDLADLLRMAEWALQRYARARKASHWRHASERLELALEGLSALESDPEEAGTGRGMVEAAELLGMAVLRLGRWIEYRAEPLSPAELDGLAALLRTSAQTRAILAGRVRPAQEHDPEAQYVSEIPSPEFRRELGEIKRALHVIRQEASRPRPKLADRIPKGSGPLQPIFVAKGALLKRDAVRFGLRVVLAITLCTVIAEALLLPGAWTSVLSAATVATGSAGASVNKSLLRALGALLGGLGAFAAIALFVPNAESVAPFLFACGLLFYLGAWIQAGGSRIAYVGMQFCIALSLVLVNSVAPSTDFEPATARLFGVLIGVAVMDLFEWNLWPAKAYPVWRNKLAAGLRVLAQAHRHAAAGKRSEGLAALRRTVPDADALFGLRDHVLLEKALLPTVLASVRSQRVTGSSRLYRRLRMLMRLVSLRRMSLEPADWPDSVRQHVNRADQLLAETLEGLAERVAGQASASAAVAAPELGEGFDTAEFRAGLRRLGSTDRQALGELTLLLRELGPLLQDLARLWPAPDAAMPAAMAPCPDGSIAS